MQNVAERKIAMFTVQELKSLNELEMLVYQYVMEHRSAVPYMRIRELATEAHVSTTTVLHFCKKMGCEGFSQFKWKLKEEVGNNTRDRDIPDSLSELQTFFWRVGTPAYQERLERAAAMIARTERIFMVGIGNSGSIASYGARYFSNLGKFSLCVSDPFYPITLTDCTNAAALVFSVSGEPKEIIKIAQDLHQRHCALIAVTSVESSTLAQLCDLTLPYYTTMRRSTPENYDFTSQIPAVYLLESVARRVHNRLNE